jgi:hypothetical protein
LEIFGFLGFGMHLRRGIALRLPPNAPSHWKL